MGRPYGRALGALAIYGDAGQDVVDEGHPVADGPPQMPGVALPWEQAVEGAATDRLVIMRTGVVLDRRTPALQRPTRPTRLGLGGSISTGKQWISWIHIGDVLNAVRFIHDHPIGGIVHVTAPHPIQNRDMLAALRSALHRPWSPPTSKPLVRFVAAVMRTDPDLALTGRRCVPTRLLDAGFVFTHPTFGAALDDLLGNEEVDHPED